MAYDKAGFRKCYDCPTKQETINKLKSDYKIYTQSRHQTPVYKLYAKFTIEILQEEFGDYSLSGGEPGSNWDEQLKALLSDKTPIWIQE